MQASEVEIHTGIPDRPFEQIAQIEVKCRKASAFSADPTIDEANLRLREEAMKIYANAVIDVVYSRGISLLSYQVLTATGTAVILESAEVRCPDCAEMVKRGARKCRFCGFEFKNA